MAMSQENKDKARARMQAYHAAKKEKIEDVAVPESKVTEQAAYSAIDDRAELQKQINELKDMLLKQALQPQQQTQVQGNRLIGRTDRYIIDPANYDNPCKRLAKEPRLKKFAFEENYELAFEIGSTTYTTLDGLNMREPKFTLSLHLIGEDESGDKNNKRYVVSKLILHEDPEAALVVARDNGIEVDQTNERDFLNEMRYIRMRDWLMGGFYPAKPQQNKVRKQEVVGNRLVDFFEVSSVDASRIPFEELSKKL
jgi:hypothetical protein